MIKFQKVRWKNFLSTGDEFTEIQLDRSPSTLIVGGNGAGKSTLLDAIAFTLFGKPHRDIKKAQLINSINGKKCIVEVEFTIGNSDFKIVRGIKPTKFEIWQNGNQINQDSNARDFQKFLEQNILKLNHKSFHQIVVLGSSSFIPFMQLSSNHRREVIEDLLDINVFSKMNQVLKERLAKIREELRDTDYNLDLVKDKIEVQKKYIKDMEAISSEILEKKTTEIKSYQSKIMALQKENEELSNYVSRYEENFKARHTKAVNEQSEYTKYAAQFQSKIQALVTEAKFFDEKDTCPTCSQSINDDLRREKLDGAKVQAKELQEAYDSAIAKSADVSETIARLGEGIDVIKAKQSTIHSNIRAIGEWQGEITSRESDIASLQGDQGDVGQARGTLEELTSQKDTYTESKLSLVDRRTYYEVISEMLKDTGIKTKIIKEYLPVINKLVNQYLQVLDFFVSFHLDENFNETIKSRHRDDFNYASFSEGEKQRIDLALMFTWRQIARMKNSAATNLLILDETFDSSLDNDGIENLMKILDTLDGGTNVFIISHKGDVLENKFRNRIEFVKEMNFSKIKK